MVKGITGKHTDPEGLFVSDDLELAVEEEIQQVLDRYQVAVEVHEDAAMGNEMVLVCQATHKGDDVILASLSMHLPVNSKSDLLTLVGEEAQAQCISLAVVAMAKLLIIQEQSRPEFNPFGLGRCAEA